ncbi:MAG: alpha/beta hydrolase [Chloroflexi bacterium]|nr:alpha/beta hydrolase [Chloroflexota bacterium]
MVDEREGTRVGIETLPGVGSRLSGRPVRKDEIVLEERGLYIESWLPERRSRRRPLYLLHGELGGSWVWERYLQYFAQRGWEGHALNLRAHFWSETADFATLDLDSYIDDAVAGLDALGRPAVVVGHGLGGLLALKVAERREVAGLVLLSPGLPGAIRPESPSHVVRLVPARFRRELIGWAGAADQIQRQNPDLSMADVLRIQHLMGAESGAARRQMLEGIPLDLAALDGLPIQVVGAGVDRLFPGSESERLAEWLGAAYHSFGAHSHYGLVLGEESHEQVADAVRAFLEHHRL